jgi:hypothetical protein
MGDIPAIGAWLRCHAFHSGMICAVRRLQEMLLAVALAWRQYDRDMRSVRMTNGLHLAVEVV